jgi:hypothetical protein
VVKRVGKVGSEGTVVSKFVYAEEELWRSNLISMYISR